MTTQLVKFEAAKQALEVARTVDEVKSVRDKAEALRLYMKQAGESLEMQNAVAEIKLRAERKAGELLQEMPKNEGQLKRGANLPQSHDVTTEKLSDLGIGKMQSSRWQAIAAMPEEKFEQHIAQAKAKNEELTTASVLRVAKELVREEVREQQKEQLKQTAAKVKNNDRFKLYKGDFREVAKGIDDESIDFIITDPPYPEQYLPLCRDMAEVAQRILKPGGSLLAMSGQVHLPAVMNMLGEHLSYHWMLSYLTLGGQAVQIFPRKVNTFWKPILWYTKGDYEGQWIGDVCKSDTNNNEKNLHHWGQSESGFMDLMKRFAVPNALVFDPFLGSGTTGLIALRLGMRFIGCDVDAEHVEVSRGRLAEVRNADL